MRVRFRAIFTAFCAIGAIATVLAMPSRSFAQAGPEPCIHYWGEARSSGYGFYHLVHITNSCARDASCAVSTDVNPEAQNVAVAAGASVEVSTFIGSPSRVFTPHVTCTYTSK